MIPFKMRLGDKSAHTMPAIQQAFVNQIGDTLANCHPADPKLEC